ncbi:hypothetical protein ACFOON_03050 [Novosphingobium piscinae]|uniref:Uncharacterized protein n=1 Tax=Novosphingobium piscinae TaxID=1507448 RepID=A0A7X1G100_9SPHN|nr:hypothetical protein [Novosphingobium piscinae]MBC2670509.1 hypothetical protein [Novosphingobium piscinae]
MTKMTFAAKTFAVATFAFGAATMAQAEATGQFQHAGTTYTYVERTSSKGQRVISGSASDGRSFRLIVGQRLVRGTFNGNPVAFSLAEVERTKIAMR